MVESEEGRTFPERPHRTRNGEKEVKPSHGPMLFIWNLEGWKVGHGNKGIKSKEENEEQLIRHPRAGGDPESREAGCPLVGGHDVVKGESPFKPQNELLKADKKRTAQRRF
jgi:hypothetical protein